MSDPRCDEAIRRLSNWGRWGAEDELGTINLITPRKRQEAAELVRSGEPVSLAIPFDRSGPQPHGHRRLNPQHTMLDTGGDLLAGHQPIGVGGFGGSDDMFCMATHAATHWDSLAHVFYDFKMYNDRDCGLVTTRGTSVNSITNLTEAIVTRGVLVDVARSAGADWLGIEHHITPAELEQALEEQGVEVSAGDVLILRTGTMKRARQNGGWERYVQDSEPGIGLDGLAWLHEHGVGAIAADTWAVYVIPAETELVSLPVHAVGIVHMGLPLGENFALDRLAEACQRAGRWEFLFVAPALPLTGAVGSPVNPLAIL